MARPPKNAEGPSATERMESAFWDCLKEMPFSEITVRDIVSRAKVNRNSYYYHYDSMWDLAQASVEHAQFAALARVLLGDRPADDADDEGIYAAQANTSFDHLRILASENGNQRLLEDAKRAVVGEWMSFFKIDESTLGAETRSAIDFVFGGVTALLAADRPGDLSTFETTLASSALLANSIGMLRFQLDPETAPQSAWSRNVHVTLSEQRIILERSVEEVVVSEEQVEEILAEAKNAPVNGVLAPHEEAPASNPETHFAPVIEEVVSSSQADGSESASPVTEEQGDAQATVQAEHQEPVDTFDEKSTWNTVDPSESTQEPAENVSATEYVERIIEEEMHSEAVFETNQGFESISEQVPEQETQTQQETEQENEAIPEQEPVNEAESQEDLAPAQDIDDVFATEARQESQPVVDLGQEPIETHESETLPPWESTVTSSIEDIAEASELISEEIAEDVAGYEATDTEIFELSDGPAHDALDEQTVPAEPADDEQSAPQDEPPAGSEVEAEDAGDEDDDSQLSFDFLF